MREFIVIFILLLAVSAIFDCGGKKKSGYAVGVGQSNIQVKIDLTDRLNPQLLPDVLSSVLAANQVSEKPDSKAFQQRIVQQFSKAVMEDPEVNYRVDLNEDGTIDPLMVVPENVQNEGAVYSLRVPDPVSHPQDPGQDADWDQIAKKESIELVQVGVTFDQEAKKVAISASPNDNLYENSGQGAHYTQHYGHQNHSWIETYFKYRLFSAILFGPYGWGFGPFYGGYYGSFYRPYPVAARPARAMSSGRYSRAPKSSAGLKTASGKSIKGSNTSRGSSRAIKQMKSKKAMAVRKQRYSNRRGGFGSRTSNIARSGGGARRSGGFGGRSRARSFGGGGSRSWGK